MKKNVEIFEAVDKIMRERNREREVHRPDKTDKLLDKRFSTLTL